VPVLTACRVFGRALNNHQAAYSQFTVTNFLVRPSRYADWGFSAAFPLWYPFCPLDCFI
jgi:hypothetical protein